MHGLRLIHNNKPASLDGREYGIYCSPEFRHGRTHWDVAPGKPPTELLRARAARKAAAAGPSSAASRTGPPRSSRTQLNGFGELVRTTCTAVADGGAAATSQDLFAPPSLCPEFPVSKFHYHGERLPRDAKPPSGGATKDLPERFFPAAEKPSPVERYRYYSEPTVMLSDNFHAEDHADGLSAARMTWRARRGETLRGLPGIMA